MSWLASMCGDKLGQTAADFDLNLDFRHVTAVRFFDARTLLAAQSSRTASQDN